MVDQDTKKKIGIYGINFLTPSLVGFLQNTEKICEVGSKIPGLDYIAGAANPFGALAFGALDLAGKVSSKIKDSKFTRLGQLLGAGFYGVQAIADIVNIGKGDYASFANLFFDGSMLYQLGKDTLENYSNNDFWDDITKW